mgnify:CR=1 FL=1
MFPAKPDKQRRPYLAARVCAALGLLGIALLGALNSWAAMYASASAGLSGTHLPTLDVRWLGPVNIAGATVPLLIDALIVVASLRYVVGVKEQRPVAGWRVAAHVAIAATVVMNALAAQHAADIPWHVVAPAVLSLVVELTARDILGQLREVRRGMDVDRIPLRLWLSAPAESARTSWRMARTGERSASSARTAADACAAARDALNRALPGTSNASVRRQITRRLWAGTIPPEDVFAACGWTGTDGTPLDPDAVLRAALKGIVGQPPASTPTDAHRAPNEPQVAIEGAVERPSPRVAGRRPNGRPAAKAQVGGDVPSELTPNEVAVWSVMLGRGDMRRSAIFVASGLSDRGAKDALDRLVRRGRVATVSRGVYRSLDPTGLDSTADADDPEAVR